MWASGDTFTSRCPARRVFSEGGSTVLHADETSAFHVWRLCVPAWLEAGGLMLMEPRTGPGAAQEQSVRVRRPELRGVWQRLLACALGRGALEREQGEPQSCCVGRPRTGTSAGRLVRQTPSWQLESPLGPWGPGSSPTGSGDMDPLPSAAGL